MKREPFFVFFLVLWGLLLGACAWRGSLPLATSSDLVFANDLNQGGRDWKLDLYAPDRAGEWPAVVLLPAWDETKEMMAPLARAVAEQGAVVTVIDYPRIEPSQATFNYGSGYRQLAEITACAVRYAHSQTADPDGRMMRLVLAGAGYGGGVAAHAALYGDNVDHRWEEFGRSRQGPKRQVRCAVNQGSSHVDTLVGLAGDYEAFVGYEGEFGREFLEPRDPALWAMLHGAVGEDPELKVCLLHARDDAVVPYESAANFKDTLQRADYDVRLESYEGAHAPVPLEPALEMIVKAFK